MKIRTLNLKLFEKKRFSVAILNFPTKPEVDFLNQNVLEVNAIFSEHIMLELKNLFVRSQAICENQFFCAHFGFFKLHSAFDLTKLYMNCLPTCKANSNHK